MSGSKSSTYPPQTGAYKVMVKGKTCPDWENYNLLRLEISVGQSYHEGEKFACTVDWASHRFEKCVVLVNDTLQRFNLMFENNMSNAESHQQTWREGSDWVERNLSAITRLPNYEIIRWDAWKRSQGYFADLSRVRTMYRKNAAFKDSIDRAIETIWQRKSLPNTDRQRFFDLSRDYLLEETAVLNMAYKTLGGISAYPGSFMELWKMFLDDPSPDVPDGLKNAHCLRIDFAKRKTGQQAKVA